MLTGTAVRGAPSRRYVSSSVARDSLEEAGYHEAAARS